MFRECSQYFALVYIRYFDSQHLASKCYNEVRLKNLSLTYALKTVHDIDRSSSLFKFGRSFGRDAMFTACSTDADVNI